MSQTQPVVQHRSWIKRLLKIGQPTFAPTVSIDRLQEFETAADFQRRKSEATSELDQVIDKFVETVHGDPDLVARETRALAVALMNQASVELYFFSDARIVGAQKAVDALIQFVESARAARAASEDQRPTI